MQAQKSIEERSNINQNQNQTNPNQITPILDRQIDEIIADLPKSYGKNLRTLPLENLKTVVSYIMVLKTEINPSRHYKKDIIEALTKFGLWFIYNNNFKDVTRDDVISFLDSLRKSEAVRVKDMFNQKESRQLTSS
jgi:hypothetical protein